MGQEFIDQLILVLNHLKNQTDLPQPVEDAANYLRSWVEEGGVEFVDELEAEDAAKLIGKNTTRLR